MAMHEGLTPFNYEAWVVMGKPLDKVKITFKDRHVPIDVKSIDEYNINKWEYIKVRYGKGNVLLFPKDDPVSWDHKLWLTN